MNHEKLDQALATVVEVLVGPELASVRGGMTELGSRLTQQVEAAKKETAAAIDRLTKEFATRIDALTKQLAAGDERHVAALAASEKKTEGLIAQARTEMDKRLAASDEGLRKELATLTASLSGVQLELHQQTERTESISGLLNGMATVFGGRPGAPPAAGRRMDGPAAIPTEEIEGAFDRMFDGDKPGEAAAQAKPQRASKG